MDPGGVGALIGIGAMICIGISCYLKDLYDKRHPEHHALLTAQPIPVVTEAKAPVLLKREQSSMRDFFSKNQASPLKVVRIS